MQKYLSRIQSTILFKGFAEREVQQALSCLQGTIKDFARKEVIFRKDDILDSAGIIIHGNVLLCKDNISGMRFIFSELGDGEIFGETALRLVQEHSGYEAVAGSECRILFVKINKIVRPGQDTCHLRGRIIENMLTLLLENNTVHLSKAGSGLPQIAAGPYSALFSPPDQKNNSACFEIPFTRSDLADYLTVDRSALSRELQRMAQDGLIRFNRNQFELLDAENQLRISDF